MAERVISKFGHDSTALEVVAGIDLRGKNAIVTGASSGIGVETARALAAAGADVTLPVRDLKKGEKVAGEIRATAGNDAVRVAELDLSDFASVRRFADGFIASGRPLHILVNNAAIMACPLARSPEGYEAQFATNHLGHFLLTGRLAPALKAGSPARVVVLTSIGHRLSPVHFDDIHFERRGYDKWVAYGQAKTANALFAVELNRRLSSAGVTANAVHPGGILTGLQQHLTQEEMTAMGWFDKDGKPHPVFKTVAGGASTSVWAATAPELEGKGGLYLEDCNEGEPAVPEKRTSGYHPHARDPEAAARLWKVSEEMVGEVFDL
ncbi:MAG TPA: oxidoreductase [Blastocatellia bacterium]|nr:oxidoreductase [Blastocatellia bacterium]